MPFDRESLKLDLVSDRCSVRGFLKTRWRQCRMLVCRRSNGIFFTRLKNVLSEAYFTVPNGKIKTIQKVTFLMEGSQSWLK